MELNLLKNVSDENGIVSQSNKFCTEDAGKIFSDSLDVDERQLLRTDEDSKKNVSFNQ